MPKPQRHSSNVPILVQKMFKSGVDVNQKVCFDVDQHHTHGISLGFTALHICVSRKTTLPALIATLVEAGADVNIKDDLGYSVLHLASMKGDVAVIRVLLNTNVAIDAINNQQQTPLMLNVAKHFLQQYANCYAKMALVLVLLVCMERLRTTLLQHTKQFMNCTRHRPSLLFYNVVCERTNYISPCYGVFWLKSW